MKIYFSLCAISVAVGTWLGAMQPADVVPEELTRFALHSAANGIVLHLAAAPAPVQLDSNAKGNGS
jgi:hypothetical protein